jgi:hypothetical protein
LQKIVPILPISAGQPSPDLSEHHRYNNRTSADEWDRFAEHRAHLSDLVCAVGGSTLAVLGAGNCNDLDLGQLADAFEAIHLLDLDDEAVRRARSRQPEPVAAKLVLHPPIDLTGAFAELPALRDKTVSPAELVALSRTSAERVTAAVPERFDTVLSACLLSQIMFSCYVALGSHPQLPQIGNALAVAHLRSLLALARPGGRVLFVTDTVSSQTFPLEERWGQQPPLALLAHLNQSDNVLSGTAISFVNQVLAGESSLLVGAPRLIEPWLWRLNPDVTLLVYALLLQRRPA